MLDVRNDDRYNDVGVRSLVTGRTGYNNTPVVRRRRESLGTFTPSQTLLPRSVSAYDSQDLYSRSRMVDVIHSEEEMDRRMERGHDLVQLPSGVRQKIPRGRHPGSESAVRF